MHCGSAYLLIAEGFFDGAAEGVDVELAVDISKMCAHGFVAQVHVASDFLRALATPGEMEQLDFAVA